MLPPEPQIEVVASSHSHAVSGRLGVGTRDHRGVLYMLSIPRQDLLRAATIRLVALALDMSVTAITRKLRTLSFRCGEQS